MTKIKNLYTVCKLQKKNSLKIQIMIILTLFLFPSFATARLLKKKYESSMTLSYRHLSIKNKADIDYAGVMLDLYLADWVSAYYSVYFGSNTKKQSYAHITMGMVAIAALARNNAFDIIKSNKQDKEDTLNTIFLIFILIPEGLNFHIRPAQWLDISPFFGFGLDLSLDTPSGESELDRIYGMELGIRLNFTPKIGSNNLLAGPYISYFRNIGKGSPKTRGGYVFGFNLGLTF